MRRIVIIAAAAAGLIATSPAQARAAEARAGEAAAGRLATVVREGWAGIRRSAKEDDGLIHKGLELLHPVAHKLPEVIEQERERERERRARAQLGLPPR